MEVLAYPSAPVVRPPAAKSRYLGPIQCRTLFAALVLLNLIGSWRFLTHGCPLDLAGDEAQYWTWSRHLAAGYYSKGPLVAWLIRGSCALLGNAMPAVRLPAVLLAAGTSFCIYWLTRKLFGSDRLALAAVALGAIVPMFAAGGTLMTIDPPMFFCWAAATCFTAKAIFDGSRWAWPAAGVAAGTGVLAKYGMLIWPVLVLAFLAVDPAGRRLLRSAGPWMMVAVTLAFLTPPLVWNAQHGWVTFGHVSAQIAGESSAGAAHGWPRLLAGIAGRMAEFVALQCAILNPALAVFTVAAAVYTLTGFSAADPHRRALRFLLTIGGGMWAACGLDAVAVKVQPNWPAPAYFTLLVLTAYFIATRWHGTWRPWRGWFWGAVAFGLVAGFLLRDLTRLYPAVAWVDRRFPRTVNGQPQLRLKPANVDPEYKLRGIAAPFASTVADHLRHLSPGAFVLCEDYMDAAQLSFYLPGQPETYFAGSYWTDPAVRRRWTQYDVWPDRKLDQPGLIGHDAVYVGWPNYAPLRQSFASVTKLPDIVVQVDGLPVRTWTVYRCEGFLGMTRPTDPGPR